MSERTSSDDPATARFLAAQAAETSSESDDDAYPSHWTSAQGGLAGPLAALSDEELLTTINAALEQRRRR